MPVALQAFTAEYAGAFVDVAIGEWVAEGHELALRFPDAFRSDRWGKASRGRPADPGPPSRSRELGVPELRSRPRYTVELAPAAYEAVNAADGLFDGRETGGGLFGLRSGDRFTLRDASGPGPHAERFYDRMRIDWTYIDRVAECMPFPVVGHWHAEPFASDLQPSDADMRCWSGALDHYGGDVVVGVIVTAADYDQRLRVHAWTVSDEDGSRVCEPASVTVERYER